MSQTHVAGGALFTAVGLGAASAAGWMHAPAWALAIGIAWGALAGKLPDIDHRQAAAQLDSAREQVVMCTA